MKKNIFKKLWRAMALGLGLGLLLVSPALAAGTDVTFSADTNIYISALGGNLVVVAGSAVASYSVSATGLVLTLDTGSHVTLQSTGLWTFNSSGGEATQCNGTSYSYITLTSIETVTLTPSATVACTGGTNGGISPPSGGGGGSYSPPANTPTASFSSNYSTVTPGQSATLTWFTTNATTVSINQGIGSVGLSGTTTVIPTSTTSYLLTATGSSGTVTQTVTVSVGSATVVVTPGLSVHSGAHGPGSVFKTPDGTVWFVMPDNTRRAFTSGGAFLSYGYLSFNQVADANVTDLTLPQGSFIPPMDGKIVCSDRDDSYAKKGTCYLITGGKRAAFTSAKVFTGLGFKFSHTTNGDVSFLPTDTNISDAALAHRPGVLVNNNGTVQLVGQSSLMGIPSMDVLASWGYKLADVVPANAADKAITQSGVMSARVTGQLSP